MAQSHQHLGNTTASGKRPNFVTPGPITWINTVLQSFETREATLNHEIAILSRQLACPHQDPADRFIAASEVYYNLHLATMDHSLIATPSLKTIS